MAQYYKISSVKRTTGTISNFICDFSNAPIQEGTYALINGMFSNTFYNINDFNNKIYFKEGVVSLTATLTNGYYNSSTILSNIKLALEAISVSGGASLTYTVSLSPTTNRLTISVSSGNIQMLMATNTLNSSKFIIGFTTDSSVASSLTGDSSINLTDTYSYNIRLEGHGIQNMLVDNASNFYSFSIPVPANSLDVFLYEPVNCQIVRFDNRISQFRVLIKNEDNDDCVLQNDFYFILARL